MQWILRLLSFLVIITTITVAMKGAVESSSVTIEGGEQDYQRQVAAMVLAERTEKRYDWSNLEHDSGLCGSSVPGFQEEFGYAVSEDGAGCKIPFTDTRSKHIYLAGSLEEARIQLYKVVKRTDG